MLRRGIRGTRRKLLIVAAVIALAGAVVGFSPAPARRVSFPGGRAFAFTIVDDTDQTTLERVRPVYDALRRYGLRTTKTVWVLESNSTEGDNRGDTLQDPAYRAFIKDLHDHGFEIALHGIRGGSSTRADIIRGLDEFQRELGSYPGMQVNHFLNRDNIHWGRHRYSLMPYRLSGRVFLSGESLGHDPASEYFWGDLARRHIRYVRQFTFNEVNLLKVNPSMPYRRPDAPYVNAWFQTSNGANADAFDELLKPENLDRLEREGGVCLVYAHLGAGSFSRDGIVDPRFEARLKDLAARNGWFAPASEILDHLSNQPGWTGTASLLEQIRLETQFTFGRLVGGGS